MSDNVQELAILDYSNPKDNIFKTKIIYEIPLYQRAFAWEDKQLSQLIEDIKDVHSKYYIGSLIVSKSEKKYEVVDGQQRLTSLFLLLNILGVKTDCTLSFACREKSNYTLHNIDKYLNMEKGLFDFDRVEPSVERGIKILSEEIKKQLPSDEDKNNFIKNLSKVVLYRIEVPENTNLNRYFEIMNTRGEQLEQHDILKAQLMGFLNKDNEKDLVKFAEIWDACSDMNGYMQMHFKSKNNETRESIFGPNWNDLPNKALDWTSSSKKENENRDVNFDSIIQDSFKVEEDEGYDEDDARVRFESIIDFPYFLIHTLKVFVETEKITSNNETVLVPKLMDDKKLVDVFKTVVDNGIWEEVKIEDDKEKFSKKFISCLLRTRYLFDRYIIKREYAGDSLEGDWSLKSLYVSGQQSKKKPYYKNTDFSASGEWEKTKSARNKNNLMVQAAFRVSYTSPKVMHWITDLLVWLSKNDCLNQKKNLVDYGNYMEKIAQDVVKKDFFDECKDEKYEMGVNTPHIVFNYLDYLLWKKDSSKNSDFNFEFRNSVEHWYPQHPSEGTFEKWDNGVDTFGNLCIIQRNVNSKFSNLAPEAKKSTFKNTISNGSLKLKIMSDLTIKNNDINASMNWRNNVVKVHEKEMIEILKDACGITEQ